MDYNNEEYGNDPIMVRVRFTQCISNTFDIETKDYTILPDEDDWSGSYIDIDSSDFSNIIEKQYYTIPELLNMLRQRVESDDKLTPWQRKKIIESCKGWNLDYTEIEDYERL